MSSESCIELKAGKHLPKLQLARIWDSFISQSQPNDSFLCSFIYVKINTNDSDGFFLCDLKGTQTFLRQKLESQESPEG